MYRQNQLLLDMFASEVASLGYELLGIELNQSAQGSTLRVYIDKEAGIMVDDCALVSRQLSALLDVEEPIKGHYDLEVSSPGLDRPLFTPTQFSHVVGKSVKLKLHEKLNNRKRLSGILKTVYEDNIVIDCDNEEWTIPFSVIERARLVPEF